MMLLACASLAHPAAAQEIPPDYAAVLKTLGKAGDFQGQRPQGQHSARGSHGGNRWRDRAHAVRFWRLGRDDQGRRRPDVMMGDLVLTSAK